MIFEDHIRVPGEENNEIDFLCAVGYADDVFVGQYFQQEHDDGDKVQKISDELENIHNSECILFCKTTGW